MLTRPVLISSVERHGVIGDRRTAAVVAADGAIDWLCMPDYDGEASALAEVSCLLLRPGTRFAG